MNCGVILTGKKFGKLACTCLCLSYCVGTEWGKPSKSNLGHPRGRSPAPLKAYDPREQGARYYEVFVLSHLIEGELTLLIRCLSCQVDKSSRESIVQRVNCDNRSFELLLLVEASNYWRLLSRRVQNER